CYHPFNWTPLYTFRVGRRSNRGHTGGSQHRRQKILSRLNQAYEYSRRIIRSIWIAVQSCVRHAIQQRGQLDTSSTARGPGDCEPSCTTRGPRIRRHAFVGNDSM
ncbi:unnamed protein product, partial [Pylaiella littoralis]